MTGGLNGSPSLLDLYVEIVKNESPAFFIGDGMKLLREQRSRDYPGTALLMRGEAIEKRLKGGTRVETQISLELSGDFGLMNPGEDWTFHSSTGLEYLVSHWRKRRATESIDEDELMRESVGIIDDGALSMSLLNIAEKKIANMYTFMAEQLESALWRDPVAGNGPSMESHLPGSLPRSLISAVNEYQPGHHNGATAVGLKGLPSGWTTQHGRDPQSFLARDNSRSLLGCQQFAYTQAANNSTATGHLFDVMDTARRVTKFKAVPMAEKFHQESDLMGAPGIFSSTRGRTLWNRTARAHDNFFGMAGPTDPSQRSIFDGTPIIDVPQLDGAAIYPRYDGSGNATATNGTTLPPVSETDANTNIGARYFLFNPEYVKHFIHMNKAYQFRNWYALDQTNPEKYVCWLRLDDMLHFTSFQRHACVYPGADISGY